MLFASEQPSKWLRSLSFYPGGNWGPEKASNLPRVTEQRQIPAPSIWPQPVLLCFWEVRGQEDGGSRAYMSLTYSLALRGRGTWGQAPSFLGRKVEAD